MLVFSIVYLPLHSGRDKQDESFLPWSAAAQKRSNIKQTPSSFDFIWIPPLQLFFFSPPAPSRLPVHQTPAPPRGAATDITSDTVYQG